MVSRGLKRRPRSHPLSPDQENWSLRQQCLLPSRIRAATSWAIKQTSPLRFLHAGLLQPVRLTHSPLRRLCHGWTAGLVPFQQKENVPSVKLFSPCSNLGTPCECTSSPSSQPFCSGSIYPCRKNATWRISPLSSPSIPVPRDRTTPYCHTCPMGRAPA